MEQVQEQTQPQSQPQEKEAVLHDLAPKQSSFFSPAIVAVFLVVILLGIITGYVVSQRGGKTVSSATLGSSVVQKGTAYGSNDTQTFKDTTEGVLQKGGIDGEGQYHLVRPGGDSQNVYLTSSLVDLSQFISHKVKVWGQTQKAQQAGWLMDVGRLEVEE